MVSAGNLPCEQSTRNYGNKALWQVFMAFDSKNKR